MAVASEVMGKSSSTSRRVRALASQQIRLRRASSDDWRDEESRREEKRTLSHSQAEQHNESLATAPVLGIRARLVVVRREELLEGVFAGCVFGGSARRSVSVKGSSTATRQENGSQEGWRGEGRRDQNGNAASPNLLPQDALDQLVLLHLQLVLPRHQRLQLARKSLMFANQVRILGLGEYVRDKLVREVRVRRKRSELVRSVRRRFFAVFATFDARNTAVESRVVVSSARSERAVVRSSARLALLALPLALAAAVLVDIDSRTGRLATRNDLVAVLDAHVLLQRVGAGEGFVAFCERVDAISDRR